MKKLIAGNWKMNGTIEAARALTAALEGGLAATQSLHDRCDFVVCPPFVHLAAVGQGLKTIALGAQDCVVAENGAFTGDISAAMLADCGARFVILGHSERRQYHGETDENIAQKAAAAHKAGLIAIICVGETEAERAQGVHESIVASQLSKAVPDGARADNTVIACEPVWAIGTGKTATPADIADMHGFIRRALVTALPAQGSAVRILYGGSVKASNAPEIFAVDDVNGALIGGASLKAEEFLMIAKAA